MNRSLKYELNILRICDIVIRIFKLSLWNGAPPLINIPPPPMSNITYF